MGDGYEHARSTVALLSGLAALYLLMPGELSRAVWYDIVGVLCMGIAMWGLRRRGPAHSRGWFLVVAGFAGWVLADLVYSLEHSVWNDEFPATSDGVYLASYLVLGLGLLLLVRGRQSRHDPGVVLDAAIIAIGSAVLVGTFLIVPIAQDSTSPLSAKLVSSAYPLADVLMLAVLVRLWRSPTSTSTALRLLSCALVLNLLADVAYNFSTVSTSVVIPATWLDMIWLSSYVVITAACLLPSTSTEIPSRARGESTRPSNQLVALTGGLLLPAVTLLLNGVFGLPIQWLVVGIGSALLSVLVLARMARLLSVVQVQAVQLAALARSDGLTGAPNRRTWDHELSRACQRARDTGEALCVAVIDLDHFKRYNDTHGHQAGDRVLREAVASWTGLLDAGDLLARYGGEEFAVLLPGRTPGQARARLDLLRLATPSGQTFSAGVALWDPATEPAEALREADGALYDAKRTGRNQVAVAGATSSERFPAPVVALQPIVDLRTGALVAMEALSRFGEDSALAVFERAHASGVGPALEAAAIEAALACRPESVDLSVNVSLASLLHPAVTDVLPDDLNGVILEITEQSDAADEPLLDVVLSDLRHRGARIAVDDWGNGFSNMDRLLRLRPEMVKIDMSLVHALASDYHRAMVRSVTTWADEVGARVCAEGVETDEQRRTLIELGVHTAQGHLFGAPAPPGTYAPARPPFPALTSSTPR